MTNLSRSSRNSECVRVVVRCRPMSAQEISGGFERIVQPACDRGEISLVNPKASGEPPKSFAFDAVYDWNSTQVELYDQTFHSLVDAVLEG